MASSSNGSIKFSFIALAVSAAWQLAEIDEEAARVERELAFWKERHPTRSSLVLRFIVTVFAMTLMTAAAAAAAHGATSPTSSASSTPGNAAIPTQAVSAPTASAADLNVQIVASVTPMMPEGMRLDGVTLGCRPPVDAVLTAVAPGFTRIQSRGFIVEFAAGARTIMCSASLNAERQMLVAARDIQSGEPVSDADFKPQWVDAFSGGSGSLGTFPSAGPYTATSSIRAGDPLYQNQIARPIAVHAGDLVTVLVKNGPITVRAQLQSQSTVAVGETATVINPTSGTPVMVTITGPKTAELVMQ